MYRRLGSLAVLAAAAGGPYVASETQWGQTASSRIRGALHSAEQVKPDDVGAILGGSSDYADHAHYQVETLRQSGGDRYRYDAELARKLGATPVAADDELSLVGPRVTDLREILRFDISSEWVLGRFARVSTVLADMRLEGLRVPVVTGTRADDLAGTLTYYFDASGALQRITIHGFTGNPGPLVETMTQHYGLTREPSLEAGVYTRRWNGQPVQLLRLTHAPVVYADAAHQKYTVFIELNQPNLTYGISPEARRIIATDKLSGRW